MLERKGYFLPHDPFIAFPPPSSPLSLNTSPFLTEQKLENKKVETSPCVTPVFICVMVHCEQRKSRMETPFPLILFHLTSEHLKIALFNKDPIAHTDYLHYFISFFSFFQFHIEDDC